MSPSTFDLDQERRRAIADAAVDYVLGFIADRDNAPASDLDGAYDLARTLRRPPPEDGRDFHDLLEQISMGAAKAYDTAGPGYLAYIPGGGLFVSAIGDLIACVTNRFVNIAAPAPAFAQIEATVTRWLCDLFELPPGSQGVLTSGGSMANFSAIVTARTAKLSEDFFDGRMYVSEHVHHSIAKSAYLAGFPRAAVRIVPCARDLCVDLTALAKMIDEDLRAGRRPFLVVGSAGTVNTGAVDDLYGLAEMAAHNGLWFHVDGAYGGFFQLTPAGRSTLHGVTRADSITLDPHKGLFLPYGTGSLLVRNGGFLKDAHSVEAHYLPAGSPDAELPDFADYSPELSRDFRGLRVWLPLHLHGVAAFRTALAEKLELARFMYERLVEIPTLEVPWEPQLSIVAFRPRGADNDVTKRLLDKINASGRVFLSSTEIGGLMFLRVCVLSHRTDRNRAQEAVEIIAKAAAGL
jgi:aromatic-L-amino-acid/L-tryptophan decarboxylase